ncbi:hypothetical protein V6N13_061946 [Hibiscus sabdariffa]
MWWKRQWENPHDSVAFFNECFAAPVKGKSKSLWLISVSSRLWTLWSAWNSFIFEKKKSSLSDLLFYTKMRALFWCKADAALTGIDESVWWLDPASSLVVEQQNGTDFAHTLAGQVQFLVDGSSSASKAGLGVF